MATVKIACPKCLGFGLTGTVVESVCSQCLGTGYISVNDTDTVAAVNTAASSGSGSPIVVTKAPVAPPAAVKVATRGK